MVVECCALAMSASAVASFVLSMADKCHMSGSVGGLPVAVSSGHHDPCGWVFGVV